MNTSLPTAVELEKLPLRAVIVYGSRTARRLSTQLRGVIDDGILDEALQLIDSVWLAPSIGGINAAPVLSAAARVAGALSSAPEEKKSRKNSRIVFSIAQAALASMNAIDAAADPANARDNMKRAAAAAERAAREIGALEGEAVNLASGAARHDYELLLAEYGPNDEVVVGDPVHCFDAVRE